MPTIPLTQGFEAIVDAEDLPLVSGYSWYTYNDPRRSTQYAVTNVRLPTGKRKTLRMHRLIMGADSKYGVDHANGNGLDNRRSNLRLATQRQNSTNRRIHKNNRSGYKGVHWRSDNCRWRAAIGTPQGKITLGHFDNCIDAAKAYDRAARRLFGEYAKLNFPLEVG